jgi:hypothetical protein
MLSDSPPTDFDDRHYALAEKYQIPRERIMFFADLADLQEAAKHDGVPPTKVASYKETTLGLRVEADDDDDWVGVRIYLHSDIPADACRAK